MKNSTVKTFAFNNLKANRMVETPFILSSTIMFILFNIMSSLSDNDYVIHRHDSLRMFIGFGIVCLGIFTSIFVFYATNFLVKKRNKEFALYAILGLEKKHIRKIIYLEFFILFCVIALISVIGGYIFGKLSFLALNFLLHDVSGTLMDYPFCIHAMTKTLILLSVLYIITIIRSGLKISLSAPVKLLRKQHSGEGEPKSRYILMIIGFLTLFTGYYIAITIKGILSSLIYFFLAALLVIFSTYMLYISFSIILLKRKKKSLNYFKPSNFLGVSGLLYRMKSNTISLASISILSTAIIITLAATLSIYFGIQRTVKNIIPREYQLESFVDVTPDNYKDAKRDILNKVYSTLDENKKTKDTILSYKMTTAAFKEENTFREYKSGMSGIPNFILVYDLKGYNERTKQHIKLNNNEILMCANSSSLKNMTTCNIGNKTFKVRNIENITPSNYAVETYTIVVKDFNTMNYISKALRTFDIKTKKMKKTSINCVIDWNIEGKADSSYKSKLKQIGKSPLYDEKIRSEVINIAYELNGGFLFLGAIIGIIFITGTILITYYKKISEGYEDRDKYQIMKKVGLSDDLIKKTTASQLIWMFFMPLFIAIIHSLVASKIVYQLLGLFSIHNFMSYGKSLISVILIFFLVYFLIYKLTSRIYYKIVK